MIFKKILILVIMPEEGEAIKKTFNMSPLEDEFDPYLPVDWSVAIMPGAKIYLAQTRKSQQADVAQVGPETASFVAWECMQAIDPDLVVNVGVASAIEDKGAEVGDIYQCDKAYYHHRIFSTAAYNEYGSGGFKCVTIKGDNSLKQASVSTSSSSYISSRDLEIMHQQGAILKDMEAAAVASVAYVREKDIFILKGIESIHRLTDASANEQKISKRNDQVVTILANKLYGIIENFFITQQQDQPKKHKISIPEIFKKYSRAKGRSNNP